MHKTNRFKTVVFNNFIYGMGKFEKMSMIKQF